jgi:hypothetical protein
MLTIVRDKTGAKFGKGKGLPAFTDGKACIRRETRQWM